MKKTLDYASSGVAYDVLDAFKRLCQEQAARTKPALAASGYREPEGTRGESAYLLDAGTHYLAHVEEGLGTKNLIADEMLKQTGISHYEAIGIDTVAAIVNDLITCGALPVVVAMHAAVGDPQWFANRTRAEDLARGFAEGCLRAGAVWGGGETPGLKNVVCDDAIALAGSAVGTIAPKSLRIAGDISPGDHIVMIASSGIHANGLTLCRKIAEHLPDGFLSRLPNGQSFGEALLAPTIIYAPFIRACQSQGVKIGYAINMTGHGWRKIMRLEADLEYIVETPPATMPPVFDFLLETGLIERREAYATFNMGVGFVVIVSPEDSASAVRIAQETGLSAWIGGKVAASPGGKRVSIPALDLSFGGETMSIRA